MNRAAIRVGDHDEEVPHVGRHARIGSISFAPRETHRDHSIDDAFGWKDSPLPAHMKNNGRMSNEGPSDGAIYAEVSRKIAEATRPRGGLRIYLAGPMTGIKEFNFPAFHIAAKMLRRYGHEVFNPAEKDMERHGIDISVGMTGDPEVLRAKHGFSLRDALRDDTHYICTEANAIAMLPGWEGSNGARAEHALAFALGHQILYLGTLYV